MEFIKESSLCQYKDKLDYDEKKEKILKNIIFSFEKDIKDSMKKTLEYDIEINSDILEMKTPYINVINKKSKIKERNNILMLGNYDMKKNIFRWTSSKIIFKLLDESYKFKDFFKDYNILKKIFAEEVSISKINHYMIPFLIQIFHDKTLTSFIIGDFIGYALIDFKNNNDIDFDKFGEMMKLYRLY